MALCQLRCPSGLTPLTGTDEAVRQKWNLIDALHEASGCF